MDVIGLAESVALCLPLSLFLLFALMPLNVPVKNMPISFSEEDFKFCKYLKCVQVVGGQVMQDVVRKMYSSKSLRTQNGIMTIRWFNMRANVDPNYGDMDCYLDCNLMEANYDITFAYRIMREICGNQLKSFKKELQDEISLLVKKRNTISHKYGGVFDLEKDVSDLKSCIVKIYEKVGEELNIDFDDNAQEASRLLDEIARAEITDANTSQLAADLERFKQSKMFKLQHDGFEELSCYYGKLRTLNPCTWIDDFYDTDRFNLDKIFTPPKLWDDKYNGDIPMKELLTAKMKNKKVPNALIIKGQAGSGKTSLCRYIVHSWFNKLDNIKDLKKFDLVFLIEIGRSNSEDILSYLREELMWDTCIKFTSEDISLLLEDLDLLFIVDGYDEHSVRAKLLVEDIFDKFHNKRIILSTRKGFEKDIEKISDDRGVKFLPITLRGFEESEQKNYSIKVFQAANQNYNDFLMYLEGRGRVLNEHLTLPLTISLLIVLWLEDSTSDRGIVNKITTATCLYYEIFNLFQEKLVDRLITNLKGRGKKKLDFKVSNLLHALGEQAWSMLREGCGCELTNKSKTEVERKCKDADDHVDIDPFEILSAFLMCESEKSSSDSAATGIEKKYIFLHRTQMEYLAADFLAMSIEKGKIDLKDIDRQVSDWRKFSEVLVYLIGSMSKKNILKKRERELFRFAEKTGAESSDYGYWWKLLSESGIDADIPSLPEKPIIYKTVKHPEVANIIEREYLSERSDWTLHERDVAAGLRLMSLVNPLQLIVTSLVINIPTDVDPFKIPDFYDALSAVSHHQKQKKKKLKVEIELHLWSHNAHISNRASNQFLLALNGWADLTNFTGSLSEVSLNEVAHFLTTTRQLKTIRCLVIAPEALNSFVKLSKSVRNLRITIGFLPTSCKPEDIVEIKFFGNGLELFFPDMKDEHLNWLIPVIRRLSCPDLKNLHLERSELSYQSVSQLVKNLKEILSHNLYMTIPSTNHKQRLETLEGIAKGSFTIEWLD